MKFLMKEEGGSFYYWPKEVETFFQKDYRSGGVFGKVRVRDKLVDRLFSMKELDEMWEQLSASQREQLDALHFDNKAKRKKFQNAMSKFFNSDLSE